VGPIPAAVAAAGLPPAAMLMAVPAPTPQEAGAAAAAAATAAFRQHMSAAASLPDASRGSGENTFVAGHVQLQRPRTAHAAGRRRHFCGRFARSARPTSDSAESRAAPPGFVGRRAGSGGAPRPRRARVSDVGRRGGPPHALLHVPTGAAVFMKTVAAISDHQRAPPRRASTEQTLTIQNAGLGRPLEVSKCRLSTSSEGGRCQNRQTSTISKTRPGQDALVPPRVRLRFVQKSLSKVEDDHEAGGRP
jgi:hypothetical protein